MDKDKHKLMGRRSFMRSALRASVCTIAMPYLIPASALGKNGAVLPSNRIVMGGIGLGNRGRSDLKSWLLPDPEVQFVAICDVQKRARERVKAMADGAYGDKGCRMYRDMGEMLARPDIDAVLIATGDRWHASASILAMRAGKDVYSEKPSCMTVREGQAVVETARTFGRIYQAGMQRLSEPNFIVCNELLRTGRLGEVKQVYAHLAPWYRVNLERKWLPAQEEPPRDILDWDGWLGPCPWRPYNSRYIRGGWHNHHDFYTTAIGEWGSHTFAQCQVALGEEKSSPIFYPYVNHPSADQMTLRFSSGVTMTQSKKGWHGTCGVRYVGSEGWVSCADGYSRPEVSSPALLADYDRLLDGYLARTGYTRQNHMRQFLNAVKSREVTVANPTTMHRTMTTVHCSNIAQWLKRDLTWDPVNERFINDQEANRMLSRAQREGWQVC